MKRIVYYVSDGTGLTAESLGHSLLAQFGDLEFEQHTLAYVKEDVDIEMAIAIINKAASKSDFEPIVMLTMVELKHRQRMLEANAQVFDIFSMFLIPLAKSFATEPTRSPGRNRAITSKKEYTQRIDAVHYALDNDDGARTRHYDRSDVIITGVSRVGKTPTCLYSALQYGLFAANYPLTEDDLDDLKLPMPLREHKKKLFGLLINPERLSAIREERKPGSKYATLRQCEAEVRGAQALFQRFGIPWVDTTEKSIEEISAKMLAMTGIGRKIH